MKIRTLELIAFGAFEGRVLRFDEDGRLALVFGANESGKSTALRALRGLLFGVPRQSEDGFRVGNAKLRVAAELEDEDGRRIAVVRRKGAARTLLDRDETPQDEDVLAPLLRGVDEDLFERLFGLDGERLRAGSLSLGASRGELGATLFEAGTGAVGLRERLVEIEERAAALFTPRARASELTKALADLDAARSAARSCALSTSEWTRIEDALHAAQQEHAALRERRDHAHAESTRLARATRCAPRLAERRRLLGQLAALAGVPDLPSDAAERRRDAERLARESSERIEALERALTRDRAQLVDLALSPELLIALPRVDTLLEQSAVAGSYERDLPKRRADLRRLESELDALRDELPSEARVKDPARPMRLDAVRIRAFGSALSLQQQELATARAAVVALETRIARGEALLAELPSIVDANAIDEARRIAEPVLRRAMEHATAQRSLDAERTTLERATSRLPGHGCDLDSVEQIAVPSRSVLERLAERETELFANMRRVDEQIADTTRRHDAVMRERADLDAGRPIPTRSALARARAEREASWGRLREHVVDRAPDEPPRSDARSLAEAVERATSDADRAADALVDDATRVARRAELERAQADLHERRDALEAERATLEEQRVAFLASLVLSAPVGRFRFSSLLELREWIDARDALVTGRTELRRREATNHALGEKIEFARCALASVLGLDPADASAELLLARADAVVAASRENEERRRTGSSKLEERREEHCNAVRRRDAAMAALATLESDWAEAIAPLGLRAGALLAEAEAALARVERMSGITREADDLRARVASMESELTAIAEARDGTLRELVPALLGRPAGERVAALKTQVDEARLCAQKRASIEARIAEHEEALATALGARAGADAVRTELRARAGVERDEDLPALEERSARKRSTDDRLEQIERDLVAEGRTPDVLDAEIASLELDGIDARIEALDREREALEAQLEAVVRRSQALEQELERARTATDARDHEERAQEARARVESRGEEWVRLRLASAVLRRAIERHRERSQRPMLARASALFARLTEGSFARVEAFVNERDVSVLRGVRGSGEPLAVEAMSEGTRDQLHLALRLAAIERHVDAHGPMPLVLDDVLVHFDDARARAALRVLGELAARTQVFCFTHHEHLLRLAREALPEPALHVQSL